MGITLGILIVCLAIYACDIVMLSKTLGELREIKRYLVGVAKSKEES